MPIAQSPIENKIAQIISASLESMGYELVRVRFADMEGRSTLQIMIDRKDEKYIDADDCAKASRQISAIVDVEDPIDSVYNLEVSSAGMDRPLTRLKDFDKYKNLEAKIETFDKIGDQRRFKGKLKGFEDENILIESNIISMEKPDNELVSIPFKDIKHAKLVMNDELIKFYQSNNNTIKEGA
ncbi:ribosome maturation factor RimP [Rickettsiales bacterium]|nr:ribosome maturation factor RimP [Rickettsiales bacterium]